MKSLFKSLFSFILSVFARAVIRKYKPQVVMVTGSVGKTSTKDAVALTLSSQFLIRKSEKSLNSEFGVPFTILGVKNPWANPLQWLRVFKTGFGLLLLPSHYPNMLVLEVGADKPGDLKKILSIVLPDAVVVTKLPEIPVHVEAYRAPEQVREEEFSPAFSLKPSAPLIINADDTYALEMAVRTSARMITYGFSRHADVKITHVGFLEEDKMITGMKGTVSYGEASRDIAVSGSVGKVQLLPIAAGIASAIALGVPFERALEMLSQYSAPSGRSRLLRGKNGSIIIDDSYNASPAAVEASLEALKHFPHAKRRIAILGDMLELGRYSVMEHERVGALAQASADLLATVGIRARAYAEGAVESSKVISFDDSTQAAEALAQFPKAGDVILVKGSQGARMEKIVRVLIGEDEDVQNLVRQDAAWSRR